MIQFDKLEENKVVTLLDSLERYALGDIKFNLENGKPIAAFILGTCFIEQVAHIVYGKRKKRNTCKERSIDLINEYMNAEKAKKYNASDIYELLRSLLVHHYTVSDRKKIGKMKYALNFDNSRTHLHVENEVVYLNDRAFVQDLEKMFLLYKSRVYFEVALWNNAVIHFDRFGILVHHENKLNLPVESSE